MCMSRNAISDDKIVGEIRDEDDEEATNEWKYVCPTMISRCNSLEDCTKDGQEDNGFCCQTSIKFPAGHPDKISTCVPKFKEIPANSPKNDANDLSKNPIGDYEKMVEYKKLADGSKVQTPSGDLTYGYTCPSMLGDCEVFKKDSGNYVLKDNKKVIEDDYACGKGDLSAKTHCCSLISTTPKMDGRLKMCMEHAPGTSPFGDWEFKDGANSIKYQYMCPSLAANCSAGDTCDSKSAQPHCCNLQATNPGIKGDVKMCMSSLGNITGKWTYK